MSRNPKHCELQICRMKWSSVKRRFGKLLKYPLVRQLWFERWFRLAFFAFIGMLVFLALFLPKIWRTSSPGFLPVIKVSGLDLVQAWSLRRTATKATAQGNFEEAHYAWMAAAANNYADPRAFRGALRATLLDPRGKERSNQAIQYSFWLLKLTGTNLVDLELAAQVLDRYKMHDQIVILVDPHRNEANDALTAVYLKALFRQRRMDLFNARWNELAAKVANNPELGLYRSAYLAGWGAPGTITDARRQLEEATQNPATKALACQLQLIISSHELNTEQYHRALTTLEETKEDSLSDHAGYWRLLGATGQKAEAIRLAEAYPNPPSSPLEVVELAVIHSEFGSRDQAIQILERYASEFGQSVVYWITYGNELTEAKRWDDLRKVALRVRSEPGIADQLSGYSYFLEGRAELALGRDSLADAAFSKAAERQFPLPGLGQKVATQLLQFGRAEPARKILVSLEKPLEGEPSYWILVFALADQMRDLDLLVKAANRAYDLRPNDPVAVNNYAAALIISRSKPQEVIKLTMQLFSQNPNSLHAVVNHSAALLLNDRPKEAEALLGRVRTNALTRPQLALYQLDLFETYMGLRKFDQARAISERIEADRLYPAQRQWLESMRQRLPPSPKSG